MWLFRSLVVYFLICYKGLSRVRYTLTQLNLFLSHYLSFVFLWFFLVYFFILSLHHFPYFPYYLLILTYAGSHQVWVLNGFWMFWEGLEVKMELTDQLGAKQCENSYGVALILISKEIDQSWRAQINLKLKPIDLEVISNILE